ncbi:MAG TPA: hypothetical protein VLF94_00025 [Chlamydiales bacterium]|nr:hypothetical protein [Chlamydiales bacterium]
MKSLILLLLSALPLQAHVFNDEDAAPKDQFSALFGTTVYALYKALDFANDHGFRYIKILSYEFNGFDNKVKGTATRSDSSRGRQFTLQDPLMTITFICYKEKPDDRNCIDLEEHRSLIDQIEEGNDDVFKFRL